MCVAFLKLHLRDDNHCQGGRGGEEEEWGNAAPSCLQNILKRVEERSEREGTALDAHKELEMVSCFHRCVPGSVFPLGHCPY